jgi:hypothetical protein
VKRVERVVVPAAPAEEARAAFVTWCTRHAELAARLGESDVRVSTICGRDGVDRLAYRVVLDEADAAALDAGAAGR